LAIEKLQLLSFCRCTFTQCRANEYGSP
jgi:hypothetical protein